MKKKSQKRWMLFFKILFVVVYWPIKMIFKGLWWLLKNASEALWSVIVIAWKSRRKTSTKKSDPGISYVPFTPVHTFKGSYIAFENFLAKNSSTIGLILGARGSGKSAIGMKLVENLKERTSKKFYAMGFKDFPPWIKIVDKLDDIETDSFVLIDEGGILFSARKSFSDANKLLSELLLIVRHRDLSVIFISQNSANLEINAIRQADYLILKPSSLLQMDFERKKIQEIYREVNSQFQKYKNVKGLAYIYSEQFKGFVSNPLPSFWTSKISKSFRNKTSSDA